MSPLDDMKSLCVAAFHHKSIQLYRTEFKQRNGREPSPEQIDNLIAIMIASGQLDREADKISKDLIKKITKRPKILALFTDMGQATAVCGSIFLLIFILYTGKIPEELQGGWDLFVVITMAVIAIIFIVVTAVMAHLDKDK